MRKIYIILPSLMLIGVGAYFLAPRLILTMITGFKPFTFSKVLLDQKWVDEFEIGDKRNPADYGYNDFRELNFYSIKDSLRLSGWFVRGKKQTDSTIFLIHGRTSNRLKTMKYLELFEKTGLDTLYNFFIADMRNSGKSERGKTYMGYLFAEDIAGGLSYLKEMEDQNHFVLYGFSMGAMAVYTALHREDLNLSSYHIDKIMVDSPLSNVLGTLREKSQELGVPDVVFKKVIELLDKRIDGYSSKLTMGELMINSDIPILIIQSNDDQSTPVKFTKNEIEKLPENKITSWFMDSAAHVKIYTNPSHKLKYTRMVNEFLRNP